jgi:hypothetical protein
MTYAAEIEVELDSTNEQDAEREVNDMVVVSASKLRALLDVIYYGHYPPEGQSILSVIEAVRDEAERQ